MSRIGILGGSFNPVHYGHLAIAEEVRWALKLDMVYLIPAARQPLKQHQPMVHAQQRMEMVRLACMGNAALIPCDIEIKRPTLSYTVHTLEAFRQEFGNETEIWFLLGADALNNLPQWYQVQRLLHLTRLAVIERPGHAIDAIALEIALPGITSRIDAVQGPALPFSSSQIRSRIANFQPVRYQLPDAVIDYINTHQLYREHDG
ncbi:MAG: nicotinate (nicotinamide) nucleotide adenylyltransferase [Chloroflexaceae bacterium]|nr:nicotinate (nicotinamide) nucleotide adenylyltransferase [Chloroflexaceae bacterium]